MNPIQNPNAPLSTIDFEEHARFDRIARLWWDETGPFWPLHRMNQLRVDFILQAVKKSFPEKIGEDSRPLQGIRILDIGCGGGILSEAMARLGAAVTGIDMVERNIAVAKSHAQSSGLSIDYRVGALEGLQGKIEPFDVVLNMEVIEHVKEVPFFMKMASELVRPQGLMFVATLNRTLRSFIAAIVGAEYVLRWLPRGTHQWRKFVRPSELEQMLHQNGFNKIEGTGVTLNPWTRSFRQIHSLAVNYLIVARKISV